MRCAAVLIAAAEGSPVWRCLFACQTGARPEHQGLRRGRLRFPGGVKCAGHGHGARGRWRQQVRNQRFLAIRPRNGSAPARVDFAGDVQPGPLTPGQDDQITAAGERHPMCGPGAFNETFAFQLLIEVARSPSRLEAMLLLLRCLCTIDKKEYHDTLAILTH
jgi:hypothetical protein